MAQPKLTQKTADSGAMDQHATPGQQAKKVIVVPKRLVNVVV